MIEFIKNKKIILTLIILFGFFGVSKVSATCPENYPDGMIFCDDYEDWVWEEIIDYDTGAGTGEYTWVHNKYYTTQYTSYYNQLQTHTFRSDDAYSGQYSLTADYHLPYYGGRTIGLTGLNYGNTENYNLAEAMNGSTQVYFKWRQKFQEDIDWSAGSQHKLLYVNYDGDGDFVYVINTGCPNCFHITAKTQTPYDFGFEEYADYDYSDSLTDNQWHTYEVFLDWTNTERPALYFSNGNVEPEIGNGYIRGLSSLSVAYIDEIELTSGSWGTGDATGIFYYKRGHGDFEAGEQLRYNSANIDNFATVVQSPTNSGTCWAKIDGNILSSSTGSCFIRDSDEPGDDLVRFVIPSNCPPAGADPGTAWEWVDDVEVWNRIPDAQSDTTPPTHPTGLSVS